MKRIVLVFLVALLVGCGNKPAEQSSVVRLDYSYPTKLPVLPYVSNISTGIDNEIIIHDSCEYISGRTAYYDGGPVLTHRGRCKFCQKRLEETIKQLLKPG